MPRETPLSAHDLQLADGTVLLRRFTPADAPTVQALAGDAAVADTTLNIIHPYPPGAAAQWIAAQDAVFEGKSGAVFAVVVQGPGPLVGAISVGIDPAHLHGEIGYWIGRPFWGHGYATAALRLLVAHCFSRLGLHRVYAHHMARNPASGRVMEKAGMRCEGTLREHVLKAGRYEDVVVYGLLRSESREG